MFKGDIEEMCKIYVAIFNDMKMIIRLTFVLVIVVYYLVNYVLKYNKKSPVHAFRTNEWWRLWLASESKRSFAIYKQLKPYLETAISHATTLGSFSTQEYKRAMCEMPLLLELVYVDNKWKSTSFEVSSFLEGEGIPPVKFKGIDQWKTYTGCYGLRLYRDTGAYG